MKSLTGFIVALLAWFTLAGAYAATDSDSSIETALSDTEATHLVFMREEEKLARDTYITLNQTWGPRVFSNISSSEQTHMDTMLFMLSGPV